MSAQNFLKSLKFCRQAPRLMILYFLEDVSAFLYFLYFLKLLYTFYTFALVFFDFSICYSRRPPEFLWFPWNLEKCECLKDSILFLYFVWQVQHIRTRPPPTTSRIPRIWVEFPRMRMSYRFYTFSILCVTGAIHSDSRMVCGEFKFSRCLASRERSEERRGEGGGREEDAFN